MNKAQLRIRLRHIFVAVAISAIFVHALYSPFYPKTSVSGLATVADNGGRNFELSIKNNGVLPIWYNGTSSANFHFVNDPLGKPNVMIEAAGPTWTILWPGEDVKLTVNHGPNPNASEIAIGTSFKNWSGRIGHSFTPPITYNFLGELSLNAENHWR